MPKNKTVIRSLIDLSMDGILVGVFGGLFSTLYVYIVKTMFGFSELLFDQRKISVIIGIVVVFALIGLILSKILEFEPYSAGSGVPNIRAEILEELESNEGRILSSKLISGGLTSFAGMSLGASGPSIHIASSISKFISKFLKKDKEEMLLMIQSGAGAGLAVAYNAPIAGAFFVIEEINKGFSFAVFYISILATLVSSFISNLLLGGEAFIRFTEVVNIPINYLGYIVLLGIATAIIGSIFNSGMIKAQELVNKIKIPLAIRMVFVLITAYIIGYFLNFTTGTGSNLLLILTRTESSLYILFGFLVVKILYTWFCYGSGVSGGLFFPILIIGGVTGAVFFSAIDVSNFSDYYLNFIFLGMAGLMAATVRAPILSSILVFEMTKDFNHLPSIIVVVLVSILVSKLFKTRPINTVFYENLKDSLK